MSDIISHIDRIPHRTVIDKNINQHGHAFIVFLTDSKMCVLNGRLFEDCDNFTSASTTSVFDYITVPHDCFNSCENFKVIYPISIIN